MEKLRKKKYWVCFLLIGVLLVIDQTLKIWVKTHMQIGEEIPLIGDWCLLHFVENEGMAFGMKFGGDVGKLMLTLFRLVASGLIMWLLVHIIRRNDRWTLVLSVALIFTGAVGNLIDSCFYGLIFNESYYSVATLFPPEGGYAGLFHGRVVDMFYFPLIDTTWPDWVPFVGGRHLEFFNAIFNVADSAITVGAILLIIDQVFLSRQKTAVADAENGAKNAETTVADTPKEAADRE